MRRAFAGLVALACAGCASAPPPDPASQLPALESRIYELVNLRRHALDPRAKDLALDSELVGVARQRSADMAAKNDYAGVPGDPHISATRLMAEDAKFQGLLGENVAAQRYRKAAGIDVEQSASNFVENWIASPRHKENLAFDDYSLTGVGAALSDDTIYVTELFATELPARRSLGPPPVLGPRAKPNGAQSGPVSRPGHP
jgi:uncharacterized protein YkwD